VLEHELFERLETRIRGEEAIASGARTATPTGHRLISTKTIATLFVSTDVDEIGVREQPSDTAGDRTKRLPSPAEGKPSGDVPRPACPLSGPASQGAQAYHDAAAMMRIAR
jgi:hypothetical protein